MMKAFSPVVFICYLNGGLNVLIPIVNILNNKLCAYLNNSSLTLNKYGRELMH